MSEKLTELPVTSTVADTDLVYVVTDPDGSPVSQATEVANVRGPGGGQVNTVGEGTGITVDASTPSAPVVGLAAATAQLITDALQPDDLSAIGLASYDDATGVIDVPASAVEAIADDAVLELPELVDAISSVVREPAPGLLAVEHRVLPLAVGQGSNTTSEFALTPTLTLIPAGAITIGHDMLLLSMAGVVTQNSGNPATLTIRVKRVLDPEGSPDRVTAWTLVATDVPSATGARPWSLSLPVNVANIGAGDMCNGVANLRIATGGAVGFDLLSSVGAIASVPADDPWALEVTAQWSVAHANVQVVHSLGYIDHLRTEAI